MSAEALERLFHEITGNEQQYDRFSKDPLQTFLSSGFAQDDALTLLSGEFQTLPDDKRQLVSEWLAAFIEVGGATSGIGGIAARLADAVRVVAREGNNVDELARTAQALGFDVDIS